jgi:S1-C subfamily serine protease
MQREQATGLLVVSVENNSPAAKGGLIVGDILVAVAGKPVLHHDELFAGLNGDARWPASDLEYPDRREIR